jgi:hypothetical protein
MHHELSSSHTACTLSFRSLFGADRGFVFPCDQQGRVDMDALSERARNNYFYARAMMGRELAYPSLQREDSGHLMSA